MNDIHPEVIELQSPEGVREIVLDRENCETHIRLHDLDLGSRDLELTVKVKGENAAVHISGVAQSIGSDKKKWVVSLQMLGKNQSGSLKLRGVVDGDGFLEFDGGGVLNRDSDNGELDIDEKIVLLSSAAKARALPVLRVETENVKSASHSASIAPFSEDIFFYLSSRGIDPENGKVLLRSGFLHA